ncbi:universal stress protein [uncultured Cellulomonas sp.]|uniref:universal stress protein n=1 Tax=uncultured Cellulomonas sp. TaxID=189682 RepID=UPI00260B711C|nr:universal stress protein [uncultured Cellulomonas sp.]
MSTPDAVVIALDGSEHSTATLQWGVTEALLRGADVVLAHATPDPAGVVALGWYPLALDVDVDVAAQTYLRDVQRLTRRRAPALGVEARLLRGPAVPSLRDLSADAQLLVVGAGAGGHRQVGSVAAHLAAHARCPVAVVRGRPAGSGTPAPVVVGVDGSASSLAAAGVAAREAALREVPLVVVHARPVPRDPYAAGRAAPPLLLGAEDDAGTTHESAQQVAQALRQAHPGLEVAVELCDGDPPRVLVRAGASGQLLVVGSRGLGAFGGMLLGSVSSEVVRSATGTVLVVHTRAARQGEQDDVVRRPGPGI